MRRLSLVWHVTKELTLICIPQRTVIVLYWDGMFSAVYINYR